MNKWLWPLKDTTPMLPDAPGRFGHKRKHDIHTGVDLYCELGTQVIAVEDGVVVCVKDFTGSTESPLWNDTQAVLVRGTSGVVVYGGITTHLSPGNEVQAGEIIGTITTSVLKKFKGRPMVMLHIELMTHDSVIHIKAGDVDTRGGALWWKKNKPKPNILRNPTPHLIAAAGPRVKVFSMQTYDDEAYTNK